MQTKTDSAEPASPAAPTSAPAPSSVSDEAIIARVLAGDIAAFEVLMRRNNARVFHAVRSIVRSDQEAEDVMQDAYTRAFERLASFENRAQFSTWLVRIAIHEALARLRRSKRTAPLDETDETDEALAIPETAINPEQRTSDRELRELLQAAIERLPEDFRVVFVLQAVEQMPIAEIAECLGLREQAVKTRLFRARQRLRHLLLSRFDSTARSLFEFHLERCDRIVRRVLQSVASESRS